MDAKPPSGRKMKARAPPPPGKPATSIHVEQKPLRDASLGSQQNLTHMKETLRNSTLDITVVLPSGLEKQSVVNGSHAVMDLLVDLCLQNHLNPSHHALEIWSSENQQPLSFKPNTLVGTLNVHTVFLKEKLPEEKAKLGALKLPEKTVRLVVNYLRTQKAVVRVSPDVPLQNILPVICAKCEVSPDHVVLLRDNVAGEVLELSKSLSELGIKELYAWDNKRETFRKSSLGNDEIDKEKKKFLGFFKVNKKSNSKAEQLGQSGADSDEESSKPAPGSSVNGCLTTPNSPSLRSRSLTLGPSLSLGNISGVSVKSEMKKRRAPPPPSPGPSVQDKSSEKVSLGSQVDLQKKKRRAPAPPPAQPPPRSPLVPSRREDQEEHRKSAVGGGRQVPQKPPRCTRGPPQLVLPPPPPYPPPDGDVVEPLSLNGEGTGLEAAESRPKLSLPLGPGGPCSGDGTPPVPPEAEETVSVSSCFASEDTTEDSGVMSSPSDIISLDSQHDSLKSKDKWATDQEDCSDQDLVGTPEVGLQKSPLWERNDSADGHLRSEKASRTSNIDEDLFVTGQFHRTLAELDLDLEEIEESYETDTSSLTSSVPGVPSHGVPNSDTEAIPVTFIGEVLDDPGDPGPLFNSNNNAGSFDLGSVAGGRACLASIQAEHSQPCGRTGKPAPDPSTPSQDIREGIQAPLSGICKDGSSTEAGPKVTSFAGKPHAGDLNTKAKGQAHGPANGNKIHVLQGAALQPASEKEGKDTNGVPAAPAWYQRGQPTAGSYGPRCGLTTYKIVPPKSEMRCYDRGVSLSTGAIKIDELGNLVNPQGNHRRTIALSSSSVAEAETQPLGKVKEFWRCNSTEKQLNQPMENSAKRTPCTVTTTTATLAEPQEEAGPKGAPMVTAPQQQGGPPRHRTLTEEGGSQPPSAPTCPLKVPAAHTTEATFLKPQRRTSSQYVASAIAKRIGPPRVHADVLRQSNNAEKGQKGRASVELPGHPLAVKEDPGPEPHPEEGHRHGARQTPCQSPPHEPGREVAVGVLPRGEGSALQERSSATHRSTYRPLVRAAQKGHASVTQGYGSHEKQSVTGNQKTSSASEPTHTVDRALAPSQRLADAQSTSSRVLVNGCTRAPGSREPPPPSPKAPSARCCIILETEQKPPESSSADVQETDGTLPPSIFGPKKKFKPVVQRPVPKDTSLHSALMEAIHSAGGKDSLRKTAEHSSEEGPKRPSYTEAESERSALLAAIRGHSGTRSLRKVSSSASEELRGFRDSTLQDPSLENPQQKDPGLLPPPAPPAPQPLPASKAAARFSQGTLNSNPVDARQALMDAIRSGTGAARLRKLHTRTFQPHSGLLPLHQGAPSLPKERSTHSHTSNSFPASVPPVYMKGASACVNRRSRIRELQKPPVRHP